jgi:hypothetical protein
VGVELKRAKQADEEALSLCARKTHPHLQAGRLNAPKIGFGFLGENARVDATLIHLHDLNVRHARAPLNAMLEAIIRTLICIHHVQWSSLAHLFDISVDSAACAA